MTDIPVSGTTIEVAGIVATCVAVDGTSQGATVYLRVTKGNAGIIVQQVPGATVLRAGPVSATLSVGLEHCLWAKPGYSSAEVSLHALGGAGAGSESFKQLKAFQRGLHCRLRVRA